MENINNINNELDKKISKVLTKYKKNSNTYITNLVLSGGGLRGIAILGALKVLHDNKLLHNITSIAATSAGALVAAMYCVGYSIDEICKLHMKLDFAKLIVPDPTNILGSYSLDNGERMEFVLTKLIESKGLNKNITLKEVYNIRKINLTVTATCLNDSQVYYHSHITTPDMPILLCLRMSSAVPIIFKPIVYKNRTFVDGALIDNYPIQVFKDDMARTLGIYVKSEYKYKPAIDNLESYAYSILECAMAGQAYTYEQAYKDCTLVIELPQISMLSNIDNKIKKQLFTIGCEATKEFINNNNKTKSR